MSSAGQAARTITRAAADLEQLLQRDRGPEPRELRAITDLLYDATAALLTAAGDIEAGIES
jgi:hypothetical protein